MPMARLPSTLTAQSEGQGVNPWPRSLPSSRSAVTVQGARGQILRKLEALGAGDESTQPQAAPMLGQGGL